jgi:3'-phosphoadenosine 5'-phosphosulfate sulfotransferase (PAPS reductase)/FAD synthetase
MNLNGIDACKQVRARTDTCFLGFSAGKDSVATWLRLREFFPKVVPIFHYWLPDLEFVKKTLNYYEEYFQTRIVRLPHPGLSQMLRYGSFQPPERYQICEWWGLDDADFREQCDFVAEDHGIDPANAWLAVGLRSADSVRRLMFFQKYGTVNERLCKFYPIAEYRKPDLIAAFEAARIKLAPEYAMMPRSFDGITIDYLRAIKENFPQDYARIVDWFPMVECEFYRAEVYNAKS